MARCIDTDFSKRPFRLNVEGDWVETRTVIIASGASARWLGLPNGEEAYRQGRQFLRHLRRLFL